MNHLKPPSELSLQGNLQANWRKFKQGFDFFLVSAGMDDKGDRLKTNLLLHHIGEDAVELYNTFRFEEGDEMKFDVVIGKFEEYCNPKKNLTYERHRFFNYSQTTETVDEYATELRKRAKSCDFGNLADELIKDRIIGGIQDTAVKERLLRIDDLTLMKALDICRAAEITSCRLKDMNEEKPLNSIRKSSVDSKNCVQAKTKTTNRQWSHSKAATNHNWKGNRSWQPAQNGQQGKLRNDKPCGRCGLCHDFAACPAYGKKCNKCYGDNHFARMCKKGPNNQKRVHTLDDKEDVFFVGTLKHVQQISKDDFWKESVVINGTIVQFQIDSGAQVNVLPKMIFDKIQKYEKLNKTKVRLVGYGNNEVPVLGVVDMRVKIKKQFEKIRFVIVDTQSEPVMGQEDSLKFNLVSRVSTIQNDELLREYEDVFHGTGCLPKPHRIRLKEGAIPVVHAIRQVPVKIQNELKKELDRLVSEGIIEKVDSPTEWCHSLVIVEKSNGSLRLCLDPKEMNEVIMREHYRIPSLEDITNKLKGAKYFSVLDANCGFWNVPLHEDSTDFCTFGTPFGRFKFLRLPFGIASAPEVFQKYMDDITEGLEGTVAYFDDCLVWGATVEEHDERLKKILQKSRDVNLKLNKDKRKIRQTKVEFVGHVLTQNGIEADPDKTRAISEMKPPSNRKELERFLGMITYLTKFIPNMSSLTLCLRELLKQDVQWEWNNSHMKAFNDLKDLVCSPPVLQYFDEKKTLKLSVDASGRGLGAILLQDEKPIAYASRSLTSAEENYAPIEKETLAIVFGAEKFHQYLYGTRFEIESDHKPLESIFKKSLLQTPPRLQRFRLRLQKYEFSVKYRPGKEMVLADTLSRASLPATEANRETLKETDVEAQVHLLIRSLPISKEKYEQFQKETKNDAELQELKQCVLNGWPECKKQLPVAIQKYWTFLEEIHTTQDILFKGNRIIVPKSLQQEMLERIHASHQGIVKCKNNARECLFWVGINIDIENVVAKCKSCQEHQRKNCKEPLIQQELPSKPWEKVGVDLCELDKRMFIVVVDYYSRYPEIQLLQSTKSSDVIIQMKSIFSRHGIPQTVISDNGPQFASKEFELFSKQWEFEHRTSSPRYPQSNGMVEKCIQAMKMILKKSEDPYVALLEYRNTPLTNIGLSPAQMLFGRKLRTRIPVMEKLLEPKTIHREEIKHRLSLNKAKEKFYYNKSSRPLQEFSEGESVRVQIGKNWEQGTVLRRSKMPRSYIISTGQNTLRRNRSSLRRDRTDVTNTTGIQPSPWIQPSPKSTRNTEDRRDKPNSPTREKSPIREEGPTRNGSPEEDISDPIRDNNISANEESNAIRGNSKSEGTTTRSGRFVVRPKKLLDYI